MLRAPFTTNSDERPPTVLTPLHRANRPGGQIRESCFALAVLGECRGYKPVQHLVFLMRACLGPEQQ